MPHRAGSCSCPRRSVESLQAAWEQSDLYRREARLSGEPEQNRPPSSSAADCYTLDGKTIDSRCYVLPLLRMVHGSISRLQGLHLKKIGWILASGAEEHA